MKISKDFIKSDLNNEHVLIPVGETSKNSNRIIVLNRTAEEIYQLLAEGKNVGEIEDRLFEKYDVDRARLQKSVNDIVTKFKEENILIDD